ncbi:FG-GAP-like repeat-containing protein [Ascidiaceihabitans sp.]|uniref:FG-GAP-like repeat-containing protein n=1 Tax=Ascidiaceihabitans sp. TaxID=1872644 RepID=UPI0032968DEF
MSDVTVSHHAKLGIIQPGQGLRFALAVLIVVVLAYLFWTGSRYPALDEKAMMSGAIQLEDPLGFEAWFTLTPDMTLFERVFFSTLNWISTNKKGMSFGILFAAAFLTVVPFLTTRSFRNGFANAALGLVIGTPLGVCVNCAAPIARGMYSAGLRAETTLAAMIASPTLNIVVLTMLFSLLPFYMAVTKIALSLFVILIAVPLICRILPQIELPADEVICPLPAPLQAGAQTGVPPRADTLWTAFLAVAKSYVSNLWYIAKMTVPLMVLAGFLGALTATLLPPTLITGVGFSFIVLVLVAGVGLFLPAPIAFDVVLCGVLISAGLAHGYVMALLFTLGTFSIYSFFIVRQSVGLKAATYLSGVVCALGIAAGAGAQGYYNWQSQRALDLLLQGNAQPAPVFWGAHASEANPWTASDDITVTAQPLAPLSAPATTPFTRAEARTIGIHKPLEFSMRDMWPPFWEGRSVASGDVDRDGDLDLVIASTQAGVYLSMNTGDGQFAPVDLGEFTTLRDMLIFNAVLVDIDNDGWLDLFLATYLTGNFIVPNTQGWFDFAAMRPVKNRDDAVMTMALSFADVDRDGDLDAALGNWAAGWYRRIPGEESRNRVIWNNGTLSGDAFTDLPGIPGETLSILFTDFDANGTADLIVGNDFEIPDYFYKGDGAGALDMVVADDALIPHTTDTTMAVKTADLMNNGHPDIYLAQIAGRSSGVSETLKMQPLAQYCDGVDHAQDKAKCLENMAIKSWYKSGNNFDPTYAARCQRLSGANKDQCRAMLVKDLAIQKRDPNVCKLIPVGQTVAQAYCALHFKPSRTPTASEIALTHLQIRRSNVLLTWQGTAFEDQAEPRGLDVGGWSWDTKIADFDHDGWQDVYIVNGTWVPNEVSPSNLFFHNQGGTFVEASGPFGLEDYMMTAAATRFDIDNDGDLDMITHTVNGPITVFTNNTQTRGIVFDLKDLQGNRDGIGAVVTLHDASGRIQRREVQLGGGFMSFDAPRVHFGLGDETYATKVDVRWATGDASTIEGRLEIGQKYTITRHSEE